jgi:hypothetical protein
MKTQIVGLGTFNGEQFFCNDFYGLENALFFTKYFSGKKYYSQDFFHAARRAKIKGILV